LQGRQVVLAGGIGQLEVTQLYLCSVVRDGDGGRISAKGAGGLCSALEPPPTPKCARGRFILEQKHWGQRRYGHPNAGLVRGWCLVLAQRLNQELWGGECISQLWVR